VNTKKPLTEEALFNMKEKAADFINEVKKAKEEIQMTARF
jgi:hypothetical protein